MIIAGFGADNIHGQGDNDTIFAGLGNDIVIGGYLLAGSESLADGGDTIDAGGGNDYVLWGQPEFVTTAFRQSAWWKR